MLGKTVLAAYGSSADADTSHHARTEDATVPREPRLAMRATDGRVFLLGDELPFGGSLPNSDDAVTARAIDKMDAATRAVLERTRPAPAPRPREPRPGDPDYVSDASFPK